jgi:hypothetical protein
MITSVLNLGIKGSELVLAKLQKIQKAKEKFIKPGKTTVTLKAQSDKQKQDQTTQQQQQATTQQQADQKKEDDSKKKESDAYKDVANSAKGAAAGLATLSAGSALKGVTGLLAAIPVVGVGVSKAAEGIITAAESFRSNVENATKINFDTVQSQSRIGGLIQGSKGGNFTDRVDLDINSQRALAESLGEKFGIVQKPMQDAIKELFKSKDGKSVDAQQAAQLAQGQFSALGTDKGFFLQKIQDQLNGLPPSLKQAMTSSLLKNVGKEEQMTETSTGARQAVTDFDNEQRARAADIATPDAIKNALEITGMLNKIDGTLNGGFSKMITTLEKVVKTGSITPLLDLGDSIGKP